MQPLRILHTEASLDLGGQEFRVLSEVIGMNRRGHSVLLAVQPGSLLGRYANQSGVQTEVLNMQTVRFPWLVLEFLRIVKRYEIDVLHTHGSIDSWTASIAGRLAPSKPLVVRARHKSTPVSRTIRHRWLYGMLPHMVVVTGEAVRKGLIEDIQLPPSHVVSIPTGVDLSQFSPGSSNEPLQREWGVSPHDLVVGTVAFFRSYKGLEYFLRAVQVIISKIPRAKIFLVGSGPDQMKLEQQVSDLGLDASVRLVGFHSDIPQVLEVFDVFVLSSVWGEGVPQALTQAMAMERAVVATNVGGVPEVVKDGENGFLVEPRDVEALADRVCVLLQDSKLRQDFGRAGRACVVERYSQETMLDHTEHLYAQLLSQATLRA